MTVQPYHITISQEVLDDLKKRLADTRWPDEVENAGWDYGTNLAYLKELVAYWHNTYDWRAQEAALNRFAQFRADVDGVGIHFIHERGKGEKLFPLIITHGWPGSFYQHYKIIPLLTDPTSHGGDPADAFDVVVPSLPGYGFSDRPTTPGMDIGVIADLWAKLMTEELGYQHFGAQGGDLGAGVAVALATKYPNAITGIHIENYQRPGLSPDSLENLSEAEQKFFREVEQWGMMEGAYGTIQGSKPQTLAYGLNDSPAGLAAWIVEKWRAWSDSNGDVESRFTKDELLTNIMVYWVTQTINSSIRLYYENVHSKTAQDALAGSDVPAGVVLFAKDVVLAPREFAERTLNVQRWTELPRGGHFPGMEEPELLVEDIRAFFRPLR